MIRLTLVLLTVVTTSPQKRISDWDYESHQRNGSWQTSDAQVRNEIERLRGELEQKAERNNTRIEYALARQDQVIAEQNDLQRRVSRIEGVGLAVGSVLVGLNLLLLMRRPPESHLHFGGSVQHSGSYNLDEGQYVQTKEQHRTSVEQDRKLRDFEGP